MSRGGNSESIELNKLYNVPNKKRKQYCYRFQRNCSICNKLFSYQPVAYQARRINCDFCTKYNKS